MICSDCEGPHKFNVGDRVFVCDGGEYHGKIATITKWSPDIERYDAVLGDKKRDCYWNDPFFCSKEIVFCAITKGTCELCGSPEGILKPPYPEKEFGDVYDLAVRKFPYAISCICPECKKLLNLRDEKLGQRNEARYKFIGAEKTRRKKEGLCSKCGGEIHTSGPCLVYEGTYETTCRCTHCGKEECYT
jgi:hypothetical protein